MEIWEGEYYSLIALGIIFQEPSEQLREIINIARMTQNLKVEK